MLPDRITRMIRRTSSCWQWLGTTNNNRYGTVSVAGRVQMIHRVVYEDVRGPVPLKMTLDHLCRNRDCVNPAHLEPVTHAVNRRRSRSRVCGRDGSDYREYGGVWRCPECTRRRQREWRSSAQPNA